jgi:two-component system chemotaxis response regulator CheB
VILSDKRVVVIGASAGGVETLMRLVRELPSGFPAPVAVVLHVPPDAPSMLAEILSRTGNLKAKTAEAGEPFQAGTIYVAKPDHHLLVAGDGELTLNVARGPRENRHRPAVDPLFRSAALAVGKNAVGVILSGTLDDGTAGLLAIKQCGGIAVVQEPSDALYPGMPQSAIEHVEVDHVVPVAAMGALLQRLVHDGSPHKTRKIPPNLRLETNMAQLEHDALHSDDRPGTPSPYSCPDCGGVLWEIQDGEYVRFRCRVGHAYSPETMLGAQDDTLEEALWTAVKTLEESARLSRRLAVGERERGNDWLVRRFEQKEQEARDRVEVIRRHLLRGEPERAAGS